MLFFLTCNSITFVNHQPPSGRKFLQDNKAVPTQTELLYPLLNSSTPALYNHTSPEENQIMAADYNVSGGQLHVMNREEILETLLTPAQAIPQKTIHPATVPTRTVYDTDEEWREERSLKSPVSFPPPSVGTSPKMSRYPPTERYFSMAKFLCHVSPLKPVAGITVPSAEELFLMVAPGSLGCRMYVPWSHWDMEGLITVLPTISKGAGSRCFEEHTTQDNLCLDEIRAIIFRIFSLTILHKIENLTFIFSQIILHLTHITINTGPSLEKNTLPQVPVVF